MTLVGPKTSAPGTDPQATGDPLSGLIFLPPPAPPQVAPAQGPIAAPGNLFSPGVKAREFRQWPLLGDFTQILQIETYEPVVLWVSQIQDEGTIVFTELLLDAWPNNPDSSLQPIRNHGRVLFLPTPGTWLIMGSWEPTKTATLVEFPASHPMVERWMADEAGTSRYNNSADVVLAAATVTFLASGMDDAAIRVQNTGANPVRLSFGTPAAASGFLLPAATATQAPYIEYQGKTLPPFPLRGFSTLGSTVRVERFGYE